MKIIKQSNEVNEVSICISMEIINIKCSIFGYINFQDMDIDLWIEEEDNMDLDSEEEDLYSWCEDNGVDYDELETFIINNYKLIDDE